jgi:hypothetical protein
MRGVGSGCGGGDEVATLVLSQVREMRMRSLHQLEVLLTKIR